MATVEDLSGNRLLASLPHDRLGELAPHFEVITTVRLRERVYAPGERAEHVWFPVDSVFSLVSEMEDGRAVEVATVGNEGFVGLPIFLQGSYTSAHLAFCQLPGRALRTESGRFADLMNGTGDLQAVLHRYTLALLTQIGRSSACNSLHTLEQRCTRWVLMTHDRVRRDEFPLTQEFLAQMLGVRRAGVNEVMQELQQRELVSYTRGRLRVADRAGLEAATCECYRVIRDEYERLIGG